MKSRRSILGWLVATLATSSVISVANAKEISDQRLAELSKDIGIMSKILQASIPDQQSMAIEGLYLANQGLVFNLESRASWTFFSLPSLPSLPKVPVAPVAPVASEPGEVEFDVEFFENIEEQAVAAAEVAIEMAEMSLNTMDEQGLIDIEMRNEQRAIQRQLRKEQRELEQQSRRLEREVRNIERNMRENEYRSSEAENSKRQAEQKAELAKLKESWQKVANDIQRKSEEIKQKVEQWQQQQQAKQVEQIQKLEKTFSEVLCDFGAGLRSLDSKEYVTFNIKGADSNRVYVYPYADVKECSSGKIDQGKLQSRAVSYQIKH